MTGLRLQLKPATFTCRICSLTTTGLPHQRVCSTAKCQRKWATIREGRRRAAA